MVLLYNITAMSRLILVAVAFLLLPSVSAAVDTVTPLPASEPTVPSEGSVKQPSPAPAPTIPSLSPAPWEGDMVIVFYLEVMTKEKVEARGLDPREFGPYYPDE